MLDEINNHPINKIAERYLKQAKRTPDPTLQYSFQLMRWALETGEVEMQSRRMKSDLLDVLETLEGHPNQQKALEYLITDQEDNVILGPCALLKTKRPEEAATMLLLFLQSKVKQDEYE